MKQLRSITISEGDLFSIPGVPDDGRVLGITQVREGRYQLKLGGPGIPTVTVDIEAASAPRPVIKPTMNLDELLQDLIEDALTGLPDDAERPVSVCVEIIRDRAGMFDDAVMTGFVSKGGLLIAPPMTWPGKASDFQPALEAYLHHYVQTHLDELELADRIAAPNHIFSVTAGTELRLIPIPPKS